MAQTNNSIEGFHNALMKNVSRFNPTIWKIIACLKKEEALSRTNIIHRERGDPVAKRRKYEDVNDRLQIIVRSYDPDHLMTFLKAVAHNLSVG